MAMRWDLAHWHYFLKSYAKTAHQRTRSGETTHFSNNSLKDWHLNWLAGKSDVFYNPVTLESQPPLMLHSLLHAGSVFMMPYLLITDSCDLALWEHSMAKIGWKMKMNFHQNSSKIVWELPDCQCLHWWPSLGMITRQWGGVTPNQCRHQQRNFRQWVDLAPEHLQET